MENNTRKIVVDENIYIKSLKQQQTIDDVLGLEYSKEIEKFKMDHPSLKSLTPLKISLLQHGITKNAKMSTFSMNGGSEWLLPAYIDTTLRVLIQERPLLQYIVNTSSYVDGLAAVSAVLDLTDGKSKDNIALKRVAEGMDLPLAKLKIGEQAIQLVKRGRALEATYEALSFLRVDVFNKFISIIANDVANWQITDAIEVLINGDGNKNSAGELNKAETITLSTAGQITMDDLVDIALKFTMKSGLPITTIIASEKLYKQILKLRYNISEANSVMNMFGFKYPQTIFEDVNVILNPNIPKATGGKEQMIALNADQSLIKYIAAGSNIQEMSMNIRNQTRLGTISEISNFAIFNSEAILVAIEK